MDRQNEIAMGEIAAALLPARPTTPVLRPYRIRFTTPTVKPTCLPTFIYVSSALSFEGITYTAILWADCLDAALSDIAHQWPQAVVSEAQEGVSAFRSNDHHLGSVQYGAVRVERNNRSWWRDAFRRRT